MCRTEGVDQVSKDASGSGEDKPVRLHRYRGQHVKARTAGPAEDRIALIPGLQYRPQELNLYSEVDPLRENIPPLRGARALSYVAVHHKREMVSAELLSPPLPRLRCLPEGRQPGPQSRQLHPPPGGVLSLIHI